MDAQITGARPLLQGFRKSDGHPTILKGAGRVEPLIFKVDFGAGAFAEARRMD